jgi:triacylglycerol lipase
MNEPINHFYDPQNARELVAFAAEAYASRQGMANSLPAVIKASSTDTLATISETASDVVIAFRGTTDLRNWLTDLDWKQASLIWSPGKVHRGFNFALNSIADALDQAIDPKDGRRIWLTGHSLGGALAMLFALRMRVRRGMNIAGVYTFGQPRVGNLPFSLGYDALLESRTFRVVHADDIVPRVPWMLGNFRHAGHEIFFDGGARLRRAPLSNASQGSTESRPTNFEIDPPWWRKLPADLLSLYREFSEGRLALLEDHFLKGYVDLLSNPETTTAIPSLT